MGKQFRKYFQCFCLAEALLAEAEVEKTPKNQCPTVQKTFNNWLQIFSDCGE